MSAEREDAQLVRAWARHLSGLDCSDMDEVGAGIDAVTSEMEDFAALLESVEQEAAVAAQAGPLVDPGDLEDLKASRLARACSACGDLVYWDGKDWQTTEDIDHLCGSAGDGPTAPPVGS